MCDQLQLFIAPGEKSFSVFPGAVRSSYDCSSVRSFNWTTVIVPVYKDRGTIVLLIQVCSTPVQ